MSDQNKQQDQDSSQRRPANEPRPPHRGSDDRELEQRPKVKDASDLTKQVQDSDLFK